MVTWVLEQNVFSERCFDEMVSHFKEKNIPYHIVKIIPFVHEIDGPVPEIEGPVVCYGSIGIQKLAQRMNWKPGVWTTDLFDEDQVANFLGRNALNFDARRMRISMVPQFAHDYDMKEFFIKPATDTKEFAGTIMSADDFEDWYDRMIKIGYLDNNDFDVIVSEPKKVGTEWRCVVVDDEIVSYSQYRKHDISMVKKEMPEAALNYASIIANDIFTPCDVYVIDVCEGPDDYYIIEYNTFNSSGLYDCDVGITIDKINEFVEKNNANCG